MSTLGFAIIFILVYNIKALELCQHESSSACITGFKPVINEIFNQIN